MLIKEKIPIFESFVNFKLSLNNKKYTKTEANSKSEHLITKIIMEYLRRWIIFENQVIVKLGNTSILGIK